VNVADERREEDNLAAIMARVLLRTDDLRCVLRSGSGRPSRALTLSAAAIGLEAVAGEKQCAAFLPRDGGRLLVPAKLPHTTKRRVPGSRWWRRWMRLLWGARSRGDGERR
jgi:hypothetical protein